MFSHYYCDEFIKPDQPHLAGCVPSSHFSIWICRYLRINRYDFATYAERVGETETRIRATAEGKADPSPAILRDLRMHQVTDTDGKIYYKSNNYRGEVNEG